MERYRALVSSSRDGLSSIKKCRWRALCFSGFSIHSCRNQCWGFSGLQLNHSLLPLTEHLASACSTKERGIKATSSSSTPASVTPCTRVYELSSLPPNR